MEGIKVE